MCCTANRVRILIVLRMHFVSAFAPEGDVNLRDGSARGQRASRERPGPPPWRAPGPVARSGHGERAFLTLDVFESFSFIEPSVWYCLYVESGVFRMLSYYII